MMMSIANGNLMDLFKFFVVLSGVNQVGGYSNQIPTTLCEGAFKE
jgi:hypothetical protein